MDMDTVSYVTYSIDVYSSSSYILSIKLSSN